MTRRDKKILWVGGLLVLAYAGWLVTIKVVLSHDIASPEDADLQSVRMAVLDKDNAFVLFSEAGERLDLPPESRETLDEILQDERYDPAVVEDLLRRNAEAMRLWQEGLERPALQVPRIERLEDSFADISPSLDLARVADLQSVCLDREGKHAEAVEQALRIVHFGRMIMGAGGDMLTWTVGAVVVEERGLARIRKMVPEARLTPDQMRDYVARLAPIPPPGHDLAEALRVEYQVVARAVEDLYASNPMLSEEPPYQPHPRRAPAPNFILQVNRTKRMIAQRIRTAIANAARPQAGRIPSEPPPKVDESLSSFLWALATGNGVGKLLVGQFAHAWDSCLEPKYVRNTRLGATRLLLALKAYKRDKDRLPERLDDLVPEYLDSVPQDDFSGQPFHYVPDKKVFYSVGKDLADDGGEARPYDEPAEGNDNENPQDRLDLVFPIPF